VASEFSLATPSLSVLSAFSALPVYLLETMPQTDIDLTVYPDECDSFGHLNQASFLSLFERARWEMLARGPGMDVFTRSGAWPAVRKAVIDYHAAAFPGDVLRFHQAVTHRGRTSFTMRQTARRVKDDVLIATAEFVFVCISGEGRPIPVPDEFAEFMSPRGATGEDHTQRLTVNGVTLAVEVRGDGPAIMFVHGYPFDRSIWRDQLEALEGYRRIAPDLRGMGQSDAPDLGYGMSTYADDLAALLDTLGVRQAVLCGQSMGGYVIFEFLRRWRDRVLAVILVDTGAEADGAEARRAREAAAATAREGGTVAVADILLPKLVAAESPPEVVDRLRRMIEATPVPGMVGALAAMRDRHDSTGLLPTLSGLPALVIVGAEDALTPPEGARRMAAAIPGARLVVVPNAGHVTPVERPKETTGAILEFLRVVG
jgi:YbgC/YbaW family acyl-CoA thioester hydrolase